MTERDALERHNLSSVLRRVVPTLLRTDPIRAFDLLVSALDEALAANPEHHRSLASSGIWRSSIEASDDDLGGDTVEDLIDAIRDGGLHILRTEPAHLQPLLGRLDASGHPMSRRLRSFFLAAHPDLLPLEVARTLLDDDQLKHGLPEYVRLAERGFPFLSKRDRRTFVDLMLVGPPIDAPDASTDREQRFRRLWIYRRLVPIAPYLEDEDRATFDRFSEEFGELPSEPVDHGLWVGPTSPATKEWLLAQDPAAVSDYLATWVPPGGFLVDSPEGLGRRVSEVVEERADAYSNSALLFKGLHATYVRALLGGLRNGVAKGNRIQWTPVLELCAHVVALPRQDPGTFGPVDAHLDSGDADPDWGWARKSIASLIDSGLEHGTSGLTEADAAAVWRSLSDLLADPEPDQEYEATYGTTNSDWSTLALNTVRPTAFLALFRFWRWLAERLPSHALMSEVREVATFHLRPEVDPSLTVRSTYGRTIPSILQVDRAWAESNLRRIFWRDAGLAEFDWAAWSAYLAFWQPHAELFSLLSWRYERAIADIGREPEWRWLRNPSERLGEHLVALFASDRASFEDWIEPFFAAAGPDLARATLRWVGRSLMREREMEDHLVQRLTDLWERRFRATADEVETHRSELATFGWWFAAARLDPYWSLARLQEVLELGVNVDLDHEVVARLASLAPDHSREAMHCVRLMVGAASQPWQVIGWSKDMKTVIGSAMASKDPAVVADARATIAVLAMQYELREFRDLLS